MGVVSFYFIRKNVGNLVIVKSFVVNICVALCLVGIIASTTLSFFATDVMNLIYGAQYLEFSGYLLILCLALIFALPNMLLGQTAIALGLHKFYLMISAFLAIFSSIANFQFIGIYGLESATWVNLICELVLFSCLVSGVCWYFKKIETP